MRTLKQVFNDAKILGLEVILNIRDAKRDIDNNALGNPVPAPVQDQDKVLVLEKLPEQEAKLPKLG